MANDTGGGKRTVSALHAFRTFDAQVTRSGTPEESIRSPNMIYLISAATAAMLAYVFWLAAFRLRPERVRSERERNRGKFAFRPKDRVRFLLGRSFQVSTDKPEWEEPLVSSLAELPVAQDNARQPGGGPQIG